MGWKYGDRLVKYQQGTTTNLRAYRRSGIMGMTDRSAVKTVAYEHGGEDAGKKIWIQRRRIFGTATEDMWDNRYGKMGWKDSDGLGKY